jgi:hypothetical protein
MHHRSLYKSINDINHFLLLLLLLLRPLVQVHVYTLMSLQYQTTGHTYGYLCLRKPQGCSAMCCRSSIYDNGVVLQSTSSER